MQAELHCNISSRVIIIISFIGLNFIITIIYSSLAQLVFVAKQLMILQHSSSKSKRKLWDVVSSKLSFSVGNGKRIKFWKDKWCRDVVSSKLSFSVGNGKRMKFWKDKWCGDEPLNVSFPSLFTLSNSKDAWVAKLWQHSNEECGWNPNFLRPLNDWEIVIVERFLARLQDKVVEEDKEDKVC